MYPRRALPLLTLLVGWALVWVAVEFLVIRSGTAPGRPFWILLHLGYFYGTAFFEVGMLRAALRAIGGEMGRPWVTLPDPRLALRFLVLKFLLVPVILVGLAALIVPGVFLLARYGMSFYLLADGTHGPVAAISESARITQGAILRLLGFSLLLLGMNALGLALLGVGLLVTIPLTALATAYVFRIVAINVDGTMPATS
jgi:hypothetical protein